MPKVAPAITSDSVKKQNTPVSRPKIAMSHPSMSVVRPIDRPPAKDAVSPDTSQSNSKFDLRSSTFNGPAQIGDHNTQNNNFVGPQPRVATEALLRNFFVAYPDTTRHIFFACKGVPTNEMDNFKKEIIGILNAKGYRNIDENWTQLYGNGTMDFRAFEQPEGIEFNIPPNE